MNSSHLEWIYLMDKPYFEGFVAKYGGGAPVLGNSMLREHEQQP